MKSETKPRILCLSAYNAVSHQRWYQAISAGLPRYQWHDLSLPPRHFRWRIRGNPLSWLEEPLLQQPWDLLIATSMVDLATLRGLHPSLAGVPALYYCHENQFFYPSQNARQRNHEPAMVNLYGALAADRVLFNSAFNRDSFIRGACELMARLPDCTPDTLERRLRERSQVLPVPLEEAAFVPPAGEDSGPGRWGPQGQGADTGPLRLVWAARWEYDKGPERLLATLQALEAQGTDYRLCVLGESFRQRPEAFDRIERDFAHRLVQFGHEPDRDQYYRWLRSAQIVLSTSLHEFQGLAVLEAIACGCVPVLPDRLVYPEQVGEAYRYPSDQSDLAAEATGAAALIARQGALCQSGQARVPDVSGYAWPRLARAYRECIDDAIARGRGGWSPGRDGVIPA
ncbi:MAG: DUF3524 domain-containing protein [Oleiphilaceae bacterium]|nr:DUF3524 domain-containing protein [Oleiphilaceae bacterium]